MTLRAECPRCGWSDIERDVPPLPYPDAMTTAFPAWTFDPYPLCPTCTKEQAMTVLSSVIFDLEHKASLLEDRQEKLAALEQDVQESLRARQQLAHLHEYTERILASGQLVSGPLPASVPISGEHPAAPVPPIEPTMDPPMETEPTTADPVPDPVTTEEPEPEATPAPEPETSDEPQPAEVTAPPAAGPAPLDEPPMTNMGRVTAWVQQRTLTEVFTVAEAQAALGMKYASIAPVFSTLIRTGHVERIEGTGTSGVPSIYRLPGSTALPASAEAEPAEDPEPVAVVVELIKPVPVQAAADPEPEPAPQVTITGGRSLRGRILEFLKLNQRRAFTPDLVAAALEWKDTDEVRACLTEMSERGAVEFDRDTFGIGLTPQPKPFVQAAPAGPAPVLAEDLLPIPERLSVDECTIFDTLRKEAAGLSERVLLHRVNWSSQRLARVIKGMLERGHVHRVGDRLRAGAAHGKKVA